VKPDASALVMVRHVAAREIGTRLRSRSFLLATALMFGFIALTVGVTAVMNARSSHSTVGFTSRAVALAPAVQAVGRVAGDQVTVRQIGSVAAGQEDVRSGRLDALVTGDAPGPGVVVIVRTGLPSSLREALGMAGQWAALRQRLGKAASGGSATQSPVPGGTVRVRALSPPPPGEQQRLVVALLVGALLYISLMLSGQVVAQGVVEEKSSRVVEVLLAVVRPWQLMLGKVVGITACGLMQVAFLAGVGIAIADGAGVLHLPASAVLGTAGWALAWYLLGFFMFALLCAAAGATVARQEEVGGVLAPIMGVIVMSFFVSLAVLPKDPGSSLVGVLSVIPLFAPVLLPMREALGVVPAWQAVLALLLSGGLCAGLIWLAARVFSRSILHTGARVRLLRPVRG
jgi:ABC-2 type transport system permease protein